MGLQPEYRVKSHLVPIIAVLLIPVALGSFGSIFNDGDVSWHIATGQWILSHGVIPKSDPFSFTWAGRPWVPIEWLAEVIMAAAYRLGGYGGISALATAALIALHAIVFVNGSRFVRPLPLLSAIVAMDIVLIPMMLARPHILAWALFALWIVLMLRARQEDRAPPLIAALLMTVWVNLHGSFVLGLVVAAVFALEAVLESKDRAQTLRQWGLFGLLTGLAALVNANGMAGVLHPLRIANMSLLPLIDEWKPSNPAVTPFFFVILAGAILLLLRKLPRMHPVRWLLLIALLGLALLQVRHQAVLAIAAALILPSAFSKEPKPSEVSRPFWWSVATVAVALIGIRVALPITPPDGEANPWKLIAAVPADLRSRPVLNGYVMGGPLILSGIRTYVDGRGDMYGDELVMGYKRITDGDTAKLNEAVDKWGIHWAILPHRYKKLVALLERAAGWRKIYEDRTGVIFVRVSA